MKDIDEGVLVMNGVNVVTVVLLDITERESIQLH